jgi:uncharacterized membrane protein
MSDARDPSIDVLRGIAILTMVEANMAPYVLRTPHPMFLRVVGTFAAPTFVFVAGMMVGGSRRSAKMGHTLRRAALLLFIAAGIDVGFWHIVPFEGVDVLYLIGLALPIAATCLRLDPRMHASIAVAIVALTPIVRDRIGYGPLLPDPDPWPFWRRWLVDGWFPVFPWLGVALLGTSFGRLRAMSKPRAEVVIGGALIVSGGLALAGRPPVLITRGGYSELFYPPTIGVLSVSIGSCLLVLSLIRRLSSHLPLGWVETYGRASLLIYVAHTALIAFVFEHFGPQPLAPFLALYVCHVSALWCIARLRVEFRNRFDL